MDLRKFEVETSVLKSEVSTSEGVISRLKVAISKLQGAEQKLSSMWESPAKRQLTIAVEKDINDLTELVNAVESFVHNISEAREEYDHCETAVGEIVNSIRV